MYESFYGFSEKPFSLFPDHRFLFLNRRYKLALSLLEFGVLNKNGMILLTGDPGMGKTTLLHKILSELDESVIVGHLTFTQDAKSSVLPWILHAFNLELSHVGPTDSFHALSDYFSQIRQQNRSLLLVVDEAQNLEAEKLEELRLLFNLNDREGPALQILLAGHTQLRDQLKDPQLSAFVQRIGTDFSLDPLTAEDTMAYIRHRVLLVGGLASLFSEQACAMIFRYTRGIPRLINQLCDTCLIYGFSDHASQITETFVLEAAKDKLDGGLFPLSPEEVIVPIPIVEEVIEQTSLGVSEKQAGRARLPESVGCTMSEQARQMQIEERGEERLRKPNFTQSLPVLKPKEAPTSPPVTLVTNPQKYWEEGLRLRDEGWCLEAIQRFKLAATHSQFRTPAWFQVAQCYLVLGRKPEALKALRICLKNSGSSPEELTRIRATMGQLLADMGEVEESERYYQSAQAHDPQTTAERMDVFTSVFKHRTSEADVVERSRPSWVRRLFRFLWD